MAYDVTRRTGRCYRSPTTATTLKLISIFFIPILLCLTGCSNPEDSGQLIITLGFVNNNLSVNNTVISSSVTTNKEVVFSVYIPSDPNDPNSNNAPSKDYLNKLDKENSHKSYSIALAPTAFNKDGILNVYLFIKVKREAYFDGFNNLPDGCESVKYPNNINKIHHKLKTNGLNSIQCRLSKDKKILEVLELN